MSESELERPWLEAPPSVGAVLVSHNGAAWLPKVLASFSHMTHAPDVWRAVDVESTDGSAELVRDSFGPQRVVRAPRGTGFGAAVQLAVEAMPRTDWIWLLHDDATVVPETLAGLLDVATTADDIAIVGPKVREWPSLRRLLEVGVTVTASGTRVTGLETGEPDAGQHDRPRDVLAVGTAGMLIRRSVWDELGGFDAELPLYFDDIDLGWRVARAGYRVRTAPGGMIFHAEASRRGIRRVSRSGPQPSDERRAAVWTQLANASPGRLWWQYIRLFFGGLVRSLGMLLAKDTAAARGELRAIAKAYAHPGKLRAARRRRAETARRSHKEVRALLASSFLPYQHGYDALRDAVVAMVKPEAVQSTGRRSTVLDQAPDETVDLDDGPSWLRQRPWLAVVVALSVLALAAGRDLLGGVLRGVEGGALPGSPETAGGWWSLLLGSERATGLIDGVPPAFAAPLALAATPVWTRPDLVITFVMLAAVPLAALTAHRLGRLITARRIPRTIWAVSYAAMVAAVGAVPQGRLGTVVALVVAPVVANQAWRLAQLPEWRTALRLGIALAVAGAFAPITLVLALGMFAVLWYLEGVAVTRHAAVAAAVVVVLLGPWLLVRGLPARWWWEAGSAIDASESMLDIVAGQAGGVAAPWWLSVPILVGAVAALLPSRTRLAVQVAWMFALFCLAVAVVGHLTLFAGASGRAELSPWVAVPAVLWLASLATACLLAAPAVETQSLNARRLLVVAALLMPVGALGWWVVRGADDPLADTKVAPIPAFLGELPGQTLVLDPAVDNSVGYRLVRGQGDYLGQEVFAGDAQSNEALTQAAQNLLGRATEPDFAVLAEAGVSAIYLTDAESDPTLAQRIDASTFVVPTGSDRPEARAWTLTETPQLEADTVPVWRRAVSGAQVLGWLIAALLILPVRARRTAVRRPEEVADVSELKAVPLPADSPEVVTR